MNPLKIHSTVSQIVIQLMYIVEQVVGFGSLRYSYSIEVCHITVKRIKFNYSCIAI